LNSSPEWKTWDTTGQAIFHDDGVIIPLCIPPLGYDSDDRLGRQICMHTLQVRACICPRWAGTSPVGIKGPLHTRLIVFVDKQPSAIPVPTTILRHNNPWSMLDLRWRKRFFVIHDELHRTGAFHRVTTPGLTPIPVISFEKSSSTVDFFVEINRDCIFKANNGDYADVSFNALGMLLITQSTAAQANDIEFNFEARVRFSDK